MEGIKLHSVTDLTSYSPPVEILFGKLESSTEFSRLELLGDGSTSSVVKAYDNKNHRHVAMKVYKPNRIGLENEFSREVFREITILKSLDHENVIKLYSVVKGDVSNLCLILEFCPYSLDKLIDRYTGNIPHDQVKCIAKQMFSGLKYLHQNYIMHRDLKPENLMITQPEGQLKIADFGLSKRYILESRSKLMTPDVVTRWYQPLEILLEAPSYGLEIDLWSAGCILMELFQRKPLFPGNSQLNQIGLIIDLLGAPSPNVWPGLVKCREMRNIRLKSQPFNRLIEKARELGCSACSDILSGLFAYDPNKRKSASECLEEDWFEQAPLTARSIKIPKAVPRALEAPPAPSLTAPGFRPPIAIVPQSLPPPPNRFAGSTGNRSMDGRESWRGK